MPILNILIFFAAFIFLFSVGFYLYLIFYNSRTRIVTNKFILQTNDLRPTVFSNVKLRYWVTNYDKTILSPNNYCELYLFDNYIAIIRRQHFVFNVFFAPVLISSNIEETRIKFNYLHCYKPDYIHFAQHIKGQVDIKLKDPVGKHLKIDITLKSLTDEQISNLERIKKWF